MIKKILIVFGTRPEAIKLAPVIKELEKHPAKFSLVVCVTAQHREMLDQVLRVFDIRPSHDLDIMGNNQTLHDITTKGLLGVKKVIEKERPDLVMVQGDTTTTFAASLAAFYAKTPVAHVEAGLRTNNKFAPFPEEVNRRLTSLIADFHFAPTEKSKQNILNEGIAENTIWVTGNTVIDALFLALDQIEKGNLGLGIEKDLVMRHTDLSRVFRRTLNDDNNVKSVAAPKLILVTGHRRENFGEGFENICIALKEIAQKHSDVEILYPVHLNPNVQEPVRRILGEVGNIHLIEPVDYVPFVYLMNRSYIIITDSGGVQEEAPSLDKPVLVVREVTERPEAVAAGAVRIVGTDVDHIVTETEILLHDLNAYEKMATAHNPYGDGKAASKIAEILISLKNK